LAGNPEIAVFHCDVLSVEDGLLLVAPSFLVNRSPCLKIVFNLDLSVVIPFFLTHQIADAIAE
jgi:hypothetical protein